MGVLNATPDSFSDGGLHDEPDAAVAHGFALVGAGVDVVDVGGESTRPGADPVSAEDEIARVVPVVERLATDGVVVSVDTSKAEVARAAVDVGAAIVNDVTGFGDDAMVDLVAASDVGLVVMHMLGTPRTMQDDPRYEDVVVDVRHHLVERASALQARGVEPERIVVDPGIGFGKRLDHNLDLLANVDLIVDAGYPVLVGASRKSFIARVIGDVPAAERDGATIAAHTLAIAAGARVVRVHDGVEGVRSARLADAIVRARRPRKGSA
ncbi:MAG: dihydropteroate synthase [Acidimicrobiia bacterium]|nr:dihydropteroate synthase [Acidimicrobiia bacterium]